MTNMEGNFSPRGVRRHVGDFKKRENPTEWSEVSPSGELKDLLGWDSKCVISMRQLITVNTHL